MNTQRILIMGSAGSGKSTLSRQLGEILDLPVVHLDKYYWKAGWVESEKEEFDQFAAEAAEKEQWIMDGNYSRTLERRLARADTVIFLDMPRWLCIYRIIKRRVRYHGVSRPDLNEGCPEKLDWAFIGWVWNYRKRSRANVVAALEKVRNEKKVIFVDSRKQVKALVKQFPR